LAHNSYLICCDITDLKNISRKFTNKGKDKVTNLKKNIMDNYNQTHRLRAFQNKELERIFGPKREDTTGER
jgi:hypothetical protein